jgi:hypothetical protein
MSDAPAATGHTTDLAAFDTLDRTLRDVGAAATLARLVGHLDRRGAYRALLDALLLQARHELGLPLVQVGGLSDVAEPLRSHYEERYVEAIRTVGRKFLEAGDIAAAWPYFRALAETEPVARAIDAYRPAENDDRLAATIEVAFHHGANPRRGFELILEHYGSCSAITAFEQLPRDETTRSACAGVLVRQIHAHLLSNLRADIAQRGRETPPEGLSIAALIAGRDWLFDDEAYHIDVSHLASTVRVAPLLTDPAEIALAVELTDYGRRLSPRHVYEGDRPFENTYEDHAFYLRALLGHDVDAAVTHFHAKLGPLPGAVPAEEGGHDPVPAQVLVGLLARVGRLEEAIEVAAQHLADYPESALSCPGVAQLCQRAGRPDRLAQIAREHDDLVNYAAAILQADKP